VFVASSVVWAYVMPSYSILKHMARARESQPFTMRVEGSVSLAGATVHEAGVALGLPTERPELQVDATLSLKLPGRCRIELSSAEGGKQLADVTAYGKKRAEGPELVPLTIGLQEACALLAERSASDEETRAAYERHIHSLGVKDENTSLARFGGQVAFVLGDTKEEQPQLWIYKDSFQPARIRFADAQGNAWDVRMIDYTSPATGEWFPRTLEVFKGGELQLSFTALKADTRVNLSDKLF
jgi:hypothetical protein